MNDTITITGIIATTPRTITTEEGLTVTSFRFASLQRRYNPNSKDTREETNWYTVSAFRTLAENLTASVTRGDHLIITGTVHVRSWESEEGKTGTSIEIEANNAGPDLVFGTSLYTKVASNAERSEDVLPVGADSDGENPF